MPSRETVWFVPLLVIGLLTAMALTIFLSPVIGLVLLGIAAIFGAIGFLGSRSTAGARARDFREQADSGVEFTERDRETLTPSEHDHAH